MHIAESAAFREWYNRTGSPQALLPRDDITREAMALAWAAGADSNEEQEYRLEWLRKEIAQFQKQIDDLNDDLHHSQQKWVNTKAKLDECRQRFRELTKK